MKKEQLEKIQNNHKYLIIYGETHKITGRGSILNYLN